MIKKNKKKKGKKENFTKKQYKKRFAMIFNVAKRFIWRYCLHTATNFSMLLVIHLNDDLFVRNNLLLPHQIPQNDPQYCE